MMMDAGERANKAGLVSLASKNKTCEHAPKFQAALVATLKGGWPLKGAKSSRTLKEVWLLRLRPRLA